MATIDIGDPLPNLAVLVENPPGTPVNVGAMVLTITLPDGTTTSPAVTNPSTGNYASTYVAVMGGLHRARWVGTGANACVLEQWRSVGDPVDIAELRTALKIAGTTTDDQLYQWAAAATEWVEREAGGIALRPRTVVDVRAGGKYAVALSRRPVKSVTTVTENGTTLTAADYEVNPVTGLLYRGTARSGSSWADGATAVRATYVVDADLVEARYRLAIVEYVRYLAAGYRGSSGQPAAGGSPLEALERARELIGSSS